MLNVSPKKPTKRKTVIIKQKGNTDDIIKSIMSVINDTKLTRQVSDYAQQFHPKVYNGNTYNALKEVYKSVKARINYEVDPNGFQDLKEPSRAWFDGNADCKSMTIFLAFVLRALHIPFKVKFTSYLKNKRIGHVYLIALLKKQNVIMDLVHEKFNKEDSNVTHSIIKTPKDMTTIRRISGRLTASNEPKLVIKQPEKPFYKFSELTEGRGLAMLRARKNELLANVARAKGDQLAISKYSRLTENYLRLSNQNFQTSRSNIISQGLDELTLTNLRKDITTLERKDFSAMVATNGIDFKHKTEIMGEFDLLEPSLKENAKCLIESNSGHASPESINELAQLLNSNHFRHRQIINTLKQSGGDSYRECLTKVYMENLVNKYFEESGSVFLYTLMPISPNVNSTISTKSILQDSWLLSLADHTFLSEDMVRAMFENGVIKDLNASPSQLYNKLKPVINNNSIEGVILLSVIIDIVKAVGTAISNIFKAKNAIERKKNNAFAFTQASPNGFKPEQADFNTSADLPNSDEDGTKGESFDKNYLTIGLGVLVGGYAIANIIK